MKSSYTRHLVMLALVLLTAGSALVWAQDKPRPVRDAGSAGFVPAVRQAERSKAQPASLPRGPEPITIEVPAPRPDAPVLSVADFGMVAEAPDRPSLKASSNQTAFLRAIAACRKKKAAMLLVPVGTYSLPGTESIAFEGLEDFIFDGQGAEFIFARPGKGYSEPGFKIVGCRRCLFRNFKVDWDWKVQPIAHAGRVVAVAAGGDSFEVEMPFDQDVNPAQFYCRNMFPLDSTTRTVTSGPEYYLTPKQVEKLSPNRLRIVPNRSISPRVGQLYCIRHFEYEKHCISTTGNINLALHDIVIYSFPGMGILGHEEEHHCELVRCKVMHRPGVWRPMTCAADACHFANTKGCLRIEDCDFGYQGDDAINIHDAIVLGVTRVDDHTLRADNVPQWRHPFAAGDQIELRQPDLAPTGFTGTLTAATFERNERCRLRFEEILPKEIPRDSILRNLRFRSAHFVVRGCKFHENRARGILIYASDGLIEKNHFKGTEMAAMHLETDPPEGFGPSNVIVRDNVFERCNLQGTDKGEVILVSVHGLPGGRTAVPVFANILFEHNHFLEFPGPALSLSSCRNVTVRDNIFINRSELAADKGKLRGQIVAELAAKVAILNNTWIQSNHVPAPGLRYDSKTVSEVLAEGNKLAEAEDQSSK